MIKIRRSEERGGADHGWLKTYHSFSFADYHDPQFMGYRSLRVINEDYVAPGEGFGSHPHKDMEIITYVLEGLLAHKDSMGHEGLIECNQVQKMSAGSGVVHSEFNASKDKPVHLLQIWIIPQAKGVTPSYQQHNLPVNQEDSLIPLPVDILQDAHILRGKVSKGKDIEYSIQAGRGVWLQLIHGQIKLEGQVLEAGDAAAIEEQALLNIEGLESSEFLLFDLK